MKTFTLSALAILLISCTAFSQSNMFGSVGAGISAPTGDFASGYNVGFNLSGNIGMKFQRMFGARFDLQYNSFGSSSSIVDGRFGLITATADVILMNFDNLKRSSSLSPYAIGGMGMYFVSPPDIKLEGIGTIEGQSKSYFGIGIGGGVAYKISKGMAVFGELKYSFTLGGEQFNYVPIKLGLMFTP
jgi:opacity protein-like surface antigen